VFLWWCITLIKELTSITGPVVQFILRVPTEQVSPTLEDRNRPSFQNVVFFYLFIYFFGILGNGQSPKAQ
jgi:hypothetical protein